MPRQLEEEKATERVQIVATPRWVARVEDYRRAQKRMPTRSDAIRQLVDEALDARDAAKPDDKGVR